MLNKGESMPSLAEIEKLTREYADARAALSEKVMVINDEMQTIARRNLAGVKTAVNKVKEKESVLSAAIEASPGLFEKPRTVIFHGIKIGLQKGKGKISIADEEKTIALIRKHFPDAADAYIKSEESLVKKAIENLSVAELKKIGCTVEESGDQVVIKATDSQVDKIVAKLLAEETSEELKQVA